MTTTILPEGWYADAAEGKAHYAKEVVGTGVLPLCLTRETESRGTREPRVGDSVCDACVADLRGAGADVTLTPGRCLGCHSLQHVIDPDVVATHHRAPGTAICAGSGIRPARYDRYDAVRSHALIKRTALHNETAQVRHTIAEAIEKGVPFRRLTDSFTMIMKLEAQLRFWNDLVDSGNYLGVAGTVLHILARKMHTTDADADLDRALQVGGAQRWLAENRSEIRKAAQDDDGAAASLLDAVLTAA